MNNQWKWNQVTDTRNRQVNESCENFGNRITIVFNPSTKLRCEHRLSHCMSWNWAKISSKNNSVNYPIVCLSIVRPAWHMFTPLHKDAVSTQKHLGSNGASMGNKIISRPLKTVFWLVLWSERNKDDVNKSTLSRKWMFKPDTSHFHRCIRRGNVYRCLFERWSNVKTDLCDRKMLSGTHQTYDNTEVRTAKLDTQQTWWQNWQILSLDRLINGITVEPVYENTLHVFVAKSLPTCANYALNQVAKDNEVNVESLDTTVHRNFCLDDFLKSVRTPQEAMEIYKKIREILVKVGFKLTKWINSENEIKSQIPETGKSTKVVKTLETEPQSSSIFQLNWDVNTDFLIVCRGTEQKFPAKITQWIILSFVSALLDLLGICSPLSIRMRFLLKSIWAAMGQAWEIKLSADHSKLFFDWCSDLRGIRTMSINRLLLENGCSNLILNIFTDASEEAMCIVAYLKDEATLRLTYVIGKCWVAPIRHMTIPKLELQAAVYGVCLRKQIISKHDDRIDKFVHWTDSSTVLQ